MLNKEVRKLSKQQLAMLVKQYKQGSLSPVFRKYLPLILKSLQNKHK